MDVWKRWQPVGRRESTQRTSKGKVIPVFNPAPMCGGIQGSGIQRQAVLISKLEVGWGGGGDDEIQALAALLRYPPNRRLEGPQIWAGNRTDKTSLLPMPGIEPRFFGRIEN
jgi:hypothetical protein